jgi:hypothetical protein
MNRHCRGEVSERLKELASKASVGEILPWVRIPPSPPYFHNCYGNKGLDAEEEIFYNSTESEDFAKSQY